MNLPPIGIMITNVFGGGARSTSPAVQMTSGASGGGIAVPDSDEYDLADTGFALPIKFAYQDGGENLLTYSQEFDNAAWIKDGASVGANSEIAPDGTMTADKITAVSGNKVIYVAATLINANKYSYSFYLKKDTATVALLDIVTGAFAEGATVSFDLDGGLVQTITNYGTTAGTTATITAAANGFYRCSLVVTTRATAYFVQLRVIDGVNSVYAWGAQLESGSVATDYIATEATAFVKYPYWLYYKYQDANNYWGLQLAADNELAFIAVVSGVTELSVASTAGFSAGQGQVIEGVFTCERESSGADGEGNFYVNGAQLGASVAIAAGTPADISNTGSLYINGSNVTRNLSQTIRAIMTNFAPTAQQVSDLYNTGIPDEWMWGSNVEQTSGLLVVGKNYRINTFEAGDDFTNVGAASNADGIEFTATGTTPTTWSNGSALVQTGATLALLPETLPISPALEWPDSANGNDADLPATGAQKVNIYV